ncbi:MAG: hypothetical protein LUE98_19885 [Tannerellaceae bacterium]|nr:hypothetical protein [Tannerellaceae bacterium]
MNERKKIFASALPWIFLITMYLAAVLFQLIYGKQLINSDLSAEMLLANELNKSKEFIISKNWYYSTELRVLYQQLTLQLGLALFPHNWHLARTASQAIILALHVICYLFLMHECKLKKLGVYSAAILTCPFGFWYMWYGTWGTIYLPYMILICLDLALIFHIVRKENSMALSLLLLFLSFAEGLGGVRMLMNFYVPMIAASLVIIFWSIVK